MQLISHSFLWAGKNTYVNRTKLYATIPNGGLWYHYAFCLKLLSELYTSAEQTPVCVSVEKDLTYSHPVQAFIAKTSGEIRHNNPVLTFSQET